MPAPRTAAALVRLLDRRNQHPEDMERIDREIHARFEQRCAVLVLDMCGFSRLTLRHGIVHFLAMIRRMNLLVCPAIEAARGRVVKTEADNVFAVFADVPAALAAAARISRVLARHNETMPVDWDLHVSIGIGYGQLLMVGRHDFFGAQLNLASKLGEDVAAKGEVLLTEEAYARAGKWRARLRRRRGRLGSLALKYHALG